MLIDGDNIADVLNALPKSATDQYPANNVPETAPADDGVDPLERLHTAISELVATDATSVSNQQTLRLLRDINQERRRLDAAYLRAVALADQSNAAVTDGMATSTHAYLKASLGTTAGRAKSDVAAARAVHGEQSKALVSAATVDAGTLAPLGKLLSEGETSLAHVDVGVRTLERIPGRLVSDENLERITGFIASHAPSTTPQQIRLLSDRLIRSLEPDSDDHYDPESFNRRSFTMSTDITGMVHGTYQLDPVAGAELRSILDPLSAPKPDQKDESGNVVAKDTRTPSQRRADGVGELIRAASATLGPASVPTNEEQAGGDRRQGNLFGLGDCGDGGAGSKAGKLRVGRRQSRTTIMTTMEQIQALGTRTGTGGGAGRQKPAAGPLAGLGSVSESESSFMAMDPTPSHCDQLGPITTGTLARMSCDGLFERVVLDAKGAILDLGLPVRLASPAQRRALAARDGGCINPGCDRPPTWCESHHIKWYSRGGPTEVGNMCLVCPCDHSKVHAGLLEIAMIDGIPYVRPGPNARRDLNGSIPFGSVRHPDLSQWVRNDYFDRLKSADDTARAILVAQRAGHAAQRDGHGMVA